MNLGLSLRVGHQHSRFWPILACFLDYYSLFWGPGVISRIYEPRGAFSCRSSALAVFSILTRFMNYYPPFWCSRVISTTDEPRGAFSCRSSTLEVLSNSD